MLARILVLRSSDLPIKTITGTRSSAVYVRLIRAMASLSSTITDFPREQAKRRRLCRHPNSSNDSSTNSNNSGCHRVHMDEALHYERSHVFLSFSQPLSPSLSLCLWIYVSISVFEKTYARAPSIEGPSSGPRLA